MNIIIGTAGSGKTRDLIKKAIEEQLPIFEVNPKRALKLKERAMQYFGETVEVFTLETIGDYTGKVLVDDLDKAFATLIELIHGNMIRVSSATITTSKEN